MEKTDEDVLNYIRSRYSFFTKAIIMKKYDKQDGGYHAFHEDNGWNEIDISRVLVCMFYLNDVKEGGETEFLHQKYKVSPTQGSLVIFPAYFTHLHKGHVPISNDKYILNIWLLKITLHTGECGIVKTDIKNGFFGRFRNIRRGDV